MDSEPGLKKLENNSLKELTEILMEDWPRSSPVIGKIKQSQRSAEQMISLNIYVDSWPQPQLVILENLTYKRNDKIKLAPLLVYARNSTTKQIKDKFDSIPLLRICYEEGYSEFQDTEYRILKILEDVSSKQGFQVQVMACPFMYSICDKAKALSSEIPSGYRISRLEYHHADFINANWKFGKSPHMLQRIKSWIQHSFSAGVFCSQTDELVAWGLISEAGCISSLQTNESHRGKGLAKAIIAELVRQAEKEEMTPIVYIEEGNSISQNLFEKIGFKRCQDGQVLFCTIVP
ncbi:uncharacterized protein LOC116293779 [Actinia tenebrosa]|uniref:Uncharacterized protein LOC116293779 n=1 Tax=Actinia tenebrosa TaxID=6105 RepID=A0A6P8HWZ8_ACTTE|nr:uncharacterized protein LOC116293779 [Actinia tenebrosa]